MSKCDKCGQEVGQLYCGKCREDIRQEQMPAVPTEIIWLIGFDPIRKEYRYGCSVKGCPCNLQNGMCSKATPEFSKELIINRLHPYDGDNCVTQFCG